MPITTNSKPRQRASQAGKTRSWTSGSNFEYLTHLFHRALDKIQPAHPTSAFPGFTAYYKVTSIGI